jgi:hypothetical protein
MMRSAVMGYRAYYRNQTPAKQGARMGVMKHIHAMTKLRNHPAKFFRVKQNQASRR